MSLLLTFILALMPFKAAPDNEQPDSLVRLMSAQSAQMVTESDGRSYRKVVGPANFLHNNTYLVCDTAIWHVDEHVINAFGNVQIIQEETVLTSDKLDYFIDDNLAEFRGSLVQLMDKEGNTLRTHFLDYNTKDSVATFERGASLKDKDGQIIESRNGSYESKIKTFNFRVNVNMFTDSVFIKSPEITYVSPLGKAYFRRGVDAWKDDNMLSADNGYYSSPDSTFFFTDQVHAMSKDQEAWTDSLYFYRTSKNLLMLGNAQLKDTTRNVTAMADYILYEDSLSRVTMRKNAALAATTQENNVLDTVYIGADNVVYRSIKKCDIDAAEISAAIARVKDLDIDPVAEYRKKAAAEKEKGKEKEDEVEQPVQALDTVQTVELSPIQKRRQKLAEKQAKKEARIAKRRARSLPVDTLSLADTLQAVQVQDSSLVHADSTALVADVPKVLTDSAAVPADTPLKPLDSLKTTADTSAASVDSIPPEPDTTKTGFLFATGKVRAFRKDLQMRCDSLVYSDLDSLVRLYVNPVIWNDGNRQYTSDSLSLLIKGSRLSRANLSSNAFIVVQEDTIHYDQIKGSEIMAFFDEDGGLKRFDALGGASAVFFIEENDALATVNKVESKMLSAILDSNQVQKVFYYDNPKNDAYPTMQLPREDKRMKGFKWDPDSRPKGKSDITTLSIIESERTEYENRPKAEFPFTDTYFPGYIDGIYREIEVRDSLKAVMQMAKLEAEENDSLKVAADSLKVATDSLDVVSDTLKVASDSLKVTADSLKVASDSLKVSEEPTPQSVQDDELIPRDKWEERELKRMERQKAREARWAELDARDAEKAAQKEQRKLQKKRAKKLEEIRAANKQAAKDQMRLDRYIKRMEKKKAKELQRKDEAGSEPL